MLGYLQNSLFIRTMLRLSVILAVVVLGMVGCSEPQQPTTSIQQTDKQEKSNALLKLTDKQKAIRILEGLQTNQELPEIPFAERFSHHIPGVDSSNVGFLQHLNSLKRDSVVPERFIEEHEYVIAHCREWADTARFISFFVFRFEAGRLAEYWENRQQEITKTKSGRSMIDGPRVPKDLDKTEYSKALLRRHFLDINYVGKMGRLPDLINQNKYHQHNPDQPDGLRHLSKLITGKKRRAMPWCQLRLLLGQGNMVFTIWDYPKDEQLITVHELWRVEDNLIVEHWDVISRRPYSFDPKSF